ncbi:hypothetical protein PUNSTDRAFT_54163 [Punctularia strigosozonata HHB-11173 SS5]|uniref:uncharacterized protein n=1 Tax=Punctularia strigosozonata (strain HHB-11173) TaxID=741275 RepID=UPI0004416506|nr:uncharacterized protein PUNSTDRAFT_54163 [Punctularia strigosozonata HHB-11173 SS5]EIN06791.1 hypothetical protein PUNSTDRAFT_54163 [Punctularia strigosozonata HHB-11173 SS5]
MELAGSSPPPPNQVTLIIRSECRSIFLHGPGSHCPMLDHQSWRSGYSGALSLGSIV